MAKLNPAQRYLKTLDSDKSRVSLSSLLNVVAGYLQPGTTLESLDWSIVDSDAVYSLRDWLKGQNKAPSTINTYISALKGVAKECWQLKLIDIETYQQIKEIKRTKGTRVPKSRALDLDELNLLLDHCMAEDGPIAMRDATLIALVYGAGLRRHEAVALEVKSYKRKSQSVRAIGKGNKERTNALNDRVIDILECWLDERGREPGPLFVRIRKGGKISNEPISTQTVYDIVVRRYKEAGLERLTPHDLRHTYATNLLESGVDIMIVQELMGHANLETTKIYDHRKDKHKDGAAKALPL